VAQHGVPDRSGPVRAGMLAVPAHDHQVGMSRQADQGPGRVARHDLLTDRDAGILVHPALHQLGQPGAGRGGLEPRAGPGLDSQHRGPAQAGFFEREGEQRGAIVQITDTDADEPAGDRGQVPDHHDRAGSMRRRVPADRPQRQRRERPGAAAPDDQHRRAGSAPGDLLRGRPGHRVGHDHQARRHPGGPGRRGVQGQLALGGDEVGDVIAVRPDLERGHRGRQRRGRHDPQRHGVQDSLAGRPRDRPQGFLGTVRPDHDGLYVHG
jgi:hypothetical protein